MDTYQKNGGFLSSSSISAKNAKRNYVFCHFCLQKSYSDYISCSLCDVFFCGLCLKIKHGESIALELQSDRWVCPKCRNGCGLGCLNCCVCDSCRKQQGLQPVGIIIQKVRQAGFTNVHDYLIFNQTRESQYKIYMRKLGRGWCQSVYKRIRSIPGKNVHYRAPLKKNTELQRNSEAKVFPESFLLRSVYKKDAFVKVVKEKDRKNCTSEIRNNCSDMDEEEFKCFLKNFEKQYSLEKDKQDIQVNSKSCIPDYDYMCFLSSVLEGRSFCEEGQIGEELRECSTEAGHSLQEISQCEDDDMDIDASVESTSDHFQKELDLILQKPFSQNEYDELWRQISLRKPRERHRETRQRSITWKTDGESFSYLDYHQDLSDKLAAASSPEEKLTLMRGFFFWLQHAGWPTAFQPWTKVTSQISNNNFGEVDDCVIVQDTKCETTGERLNVQSDASRSSKRRCVGPPNSETNPGEYRRCSCKSVKVKREA